MQSTLLEYGQQNILLANLTVGAGQTAKSGTEKKSQETSQASAESEKNLKRLMNEMAQADKKQVGTRLLTFFCFFMGLTWVSMRFDQNLYFL